MWGTKRFLVYYFISGIGAGITHLIFAPLFGQIGPVVGASGAIYGVMIAFAVMFPDRHIFLYFLTISGSASAASLSGTATRTISHPASASW